MTETYAPTTQPYLRAKIVMEGRIECLTGLHIGGAETGVDVGGIDKFVVRNPLNDQPYIPGSSLKGKIRNLVEYALLTDAVLRAAAHGVAVMPNDPRTKGLFGVALNKDDKDNTATARSSASKVLFRDGVMVIDEANPAKRFANGLKYTERKAENTLQRVTGKANPRQIERVPAGTQFRFGLVLNVDEENVAQIAAQLGHLKLGFDLLEIDGLGGSVSRGYGQIKVHWQTITIWQVAATGLTAAETFTAPVNFDPVIAQVTKLWPQKAEAGR